MYCSTLLELFYTTIIHYILKMLRLHLFNIFTIKTTWTLHAPLCFLIMKTLTNVLLLLVCNLTGRINKLDSNVHYFVTFCLLVSSSLITLLSSSQEIQYSIGNVISFPSLSIPFKSEDA